MCTPTDSKIVGTKPAKNAEPIVSSHNYSIFEHICVRITTIKLQFSRQSEERVKFGG